MVLRADSQLGQAAPDEVQVSWAVDTPASQEPWPQSLQIILLKDSEVGREGQRLHQVATCQELVAALAGKAGTTRVTPGDCSGGRTDPPSPPSCLVLPEG